MAGTRKSGVSWNGAHMKELRKLERRLANETEAWARMVCKEKSDVNYNGARE